MAIFGGPVLAVENIWRAENLHVISTRRLKVTCKFAEPVEFPATSSGPPKMAIFAFIGPCSVKSSDFWAPTHSSYSCYMEAETKIIGPFGWINAEKTLFAYLNVDFGRFRKMWFFHILVGSDPWKSAKIKCLKNGQNQRWDTQIAFFRHLFTLRARIFVSTSMEHK